MTTSSFNKPRLYLYHTAAWGSLGDLECCGVDANQGAPWAIQSVDHWGFNVRCVKDTRDCLTVLIRIRTF
eukprot:scaffold90134_cov51-Cyclotella_meneghiniana.AAC.9